MRELDGRHLRSRVTGRAAIERSLRSLLIRAHRFGRHRATSPADCRWAAQMIDALTAATFAAPEAPGNRAGHAGTAAAGFAQLSHEFARSQVTGSHD